MRTSTINHSPSRTKRVMIVDDCHEILEMSQEILTSQGYLVETAACGKDCLEKLKAFAPDLFLVDIMMPEMNDWELLKRLEGVGAHHNAEIAVFTVKQTSEPDIARFRENPGNYYIQKPVGGRELLDVVGGIQEGVGVPGS